jgi:hypothetical protein
VLLLVFRRQWRAVLPAGAVVAVAYGTALLVLGPAAMLRYLTSIVPENVQSYRAVWHNIAPYTLWFRLFDAPVPSAGEPWPAGAPLPWYTVPLVVAPAAATSLAALGTLGLIAGGCWLGFRRPLPEALGLLIGVSLLAAPVAWTHYLVLLGVPFALVLRHLRAHQWPRGPTRLTGLATAVVLVPYPGWMALAWGLYPADRLAGGLHFPPGAVWCALAPMLGAMLLVGVFVRVTPPYPAAPCR